MDTESFVDSGAFSRAEARTSELFFKLQKLYENHPHDHELVVLLSPLYAESELDPEQAAALMTTMWTGLKERFLEGRPGYNPKGDISPEDVHYIFEQLVLSLEEAIKEMNDHMS